MSPGRVHDIVHDLYLQAGLIAKSKAVRYELRAHSIRKFFRTQLAVLGVNNDYINYMMGHKVDIYHDIESKGPEFLRRIYAAANISIRPRTQLSQKEMAMKILESMGVKPEELLISDAQAYLHRSYISTVDHERHELNLLTIALQDAVTERVIQGKKHSIIS